MLRNEKDKKCEHEVSRNFPSVTNRHENKSTSSHSKDSICALFRSTASTAQLHLVLKRNISVSSIYLLWHLPSFWLLDLFQMSELEFQRDFSLIISQTLRFIWCPVICTDVKQWFTGSISEETRAFITNTSELCDVRHVHWPEDVCLKLHLWCLPCSPGLVWGTYRKRYFFLFAWKQIRHPKGRGLCLKGA